MDQAGQLFQRLRRRGEVVQDHVQHHAIGRFGGILQGIGQFQADVAQSFFLAALARQFQHRRAVVQRRDLAETPGEFRQEPAVPGPTSSAVAPGAKASASSKANTLSRYCGSPAIRSCWAWNLSAARAKKSWLTAARWACTASIRARTSSGSARSSTFQQRRVQRAAGAFGQGQRTSVEDRVAFAARRHQPGLGQHLEVVAHARLADGEDLRQLQHAERIVGQGAQHVQSQRVASRLAQRGERVVVVWSYRRHAKAHGGAVSTGSEPRQCLYQKFLILMTGGRRAIVIRLRQASGKTGRQRHTVPCRSVIAPWAFGGRKWRPFSLLVFRPATP